MQISHTVLLLVCSSTVGSSALPASHVSGSPSADIATPTVRHPTPYASATADEEQLADLNNGAKAEDRGRLRPVPHAAVSKS